MAGSAVILLLLLYSTIVLIEAQTGFLSIDCGAEQGYVDAQTGIEWVPDGSYTSSGLNAKVENQSVSETLRTVRYFPNSSESNCYVLPIKSGQKYFFRAIFFYGNYDAQSSWPSFFLVFARGDWNYELVGSDYADDPAVHVELIFPPKQSSNVDLCLSTSDPANSVPFISSLELRPLPTSFYSQNADFANHYLHLQFRRYFNQDPNAVLSYPQDDYDRRWLPRSFIPPFANRISSNSTIDTTGYINKPPSQVLMTALEGINGSNFNYTVAMGKVSSDLLFFFYFWELRTDRNATDVREFNLVISCDNGETSTPNKLTIKPNDTWTSYFWGGWGTSDSATFTFSLTPTSNSTLPPILNAFEIFAYNESTALPPSSPPPPSKPSSLTPPPPPPHIPRPESNSAKRVKSLSCYFILAVLLGIFL